MGIKGLSTFIKKKFTGWKPANIQRWSHLLIDGNNIFYELYKDNCTWSFGGEYDKFSCVVKKFFEEAGFNNPIVIFDGPSYNDNKRETVYDRRIQSIVELHESQCAGFNNDRSNTSVAPLFLISVFRNVLKHLDIEFRTANGDADNMIAALANHYECPVLSSDSDFFLFPLKHGVIYFERYYEDMSSDSLFNIDEFMRQFSLQEYELCLILPLLFGNDFLKSALKWSLYLYRQHLQILAGYRTAKEYMIREDNIIYGEAFRNFKVAKEFYSNLDLPSNNLTDDDHEYVLMKDPCVSAMPDWVFKAENFPSHLLSVYHRKSYLLPRVVEVIKMVSAWEMSRYIRQFLYGIIGIPNVTEIIRKSSYPDLEEVPVCPKSTTPPIGINDLTSIGNEMLPDLVLSILKCHKISEDDIEHIFNKIPSEWKLPIAATFYWYRHLDIPLTQRRDLVKSLLLIFLRRFPEKEYSLRPVTIEDHWTALHAFAQWQCVYFDATALDCIAREPFPATSPASLYSGEAAMYYAMMNDDREKEIHKMATSSDSKKDWELFGKFLYLVTGLDEDSGQRGKHAIKEKPADWTVFRH